VFRHIPFRFMRVVIVAAGPPVLVGDRGTLTLAVSAMGVIDTFAS
jgi:hypothetical protein